MYRRIACAVVALLLPSALTSVAAEERIQPTAEYQANVRFEAGGLILSGPVHYALEKEKQTLMLQGMSAPAREMIVRKDRNVAWVLDETTKSYFSAPLPSNSISGSNFLSTPLIEKIRVAPETIDGIEATRYQVKFIVTDGGQLVGDIWLTPNNIALRFEGQFLHEGQSTPFRMRLTNLQVGPQAAEIFEVPKDFKLVPPSHPTMGIFRRLGDVD